MKTIEERLDILEEKMRRESFRKNTGLGNEVGYYVFDYEPQQELIVRERDFIASALGGKGTSSREVIRNYFLNDFFKDHCRIYQKRPIYWLFDSGKQNGFKALVYMHRWDKNSIGRVLVYLHKIQEKYEIEVRAIDALIEHMTDKRQEAVEERRKDHMLKQVAEIKEYDESLEHMTNEFIDIDLDDGVKVNYEKVQTDRNGMKYKILAPIK
ncbi:MAG: BREX-1 system adenine-specific DNA-methyltransferase PglX [Lachnospiraceae bacterium]|nr:BREX-1 system adenine-specific DNA-methyltransferase PglX [Lachnospiraceae bacterium]